MDTHSDDPDDRDQRRRQQVKRLTAHGARTGTIYDLTGYSRNRQSYLRMRWGVPDEERARGPSPRAFKRSFEDAEVHSEASCAGIICVLFGANAYERKLRSPYRRGDVDTGERLAEGYEAFQALFPHSELEFDEFALIATGLTTGEEIQLVCCSGCGGVVLMDLLGKKKRGCVRCEEASEGQGKKKRKAAKKSEKTLATEHQSECGVVRHSRSQGSEDSGYRSQPEDDCTPREMPDERIRR